MKKLRIALVFTLAFMLFGISNVFAETKGDIEIISSPATIEETGPVLKNNVINYSTSDPSVGRNTNGWWLGWKIIAPASAKAGIENGTVKYTNGSKDADGNLIMKNFFNAKDGLDGDRYWMQSWNLVSPDNGSYLQNALNRSGKLYYYYNFYWDGVDNDPHAVRSEIDVTNVTLNKDGSVYYKTENGQFTVFQGKTVTHTAAVAATCTNSGNIEYWTLDGVNYSDKGLQTSVEEVVTDKLTDSCEAGETVKVEVTDNVGGATIANDASKLSDIVPLTEEEEDAIANGSNFYVFVEVSDISDSVSDTDKELINEKLGDDLKVGMYLDINLFKQFDGSTSTRVTETNGKIKISFEIPENLQKDNRNYYIIRIHNGVATKITPTRDGNTLTFETDQFSTYALAYADNATTTTNTNTISNPATGDGIITYVSLMIISLVGISTTFIYRKKFNI